MNGEIFSIPGISPALVGDSPELVSAIELNQWADRTEAKTVFPELMRRLFAQTPGITNLEIRVREGTSASGWDGAATSTGSTYLPAGELRCEFGTNQKVKDKADKDYTKRAEELGAEIDKYVYEAYSWGVGEDESRDGLYCGFEGVVGAAVIGV